jgi:hypothetical protein
VALGTGWGFGGAPRRSGPARCVPVCRPSSQRVASACGARRAGRGQTQHSPCSNQRQTPIICTVQSTCASTPPLLVFIWSWSAVCAANQTHCFVLPHLPELGCFFLCSCAKIGVWSRGRERRPCGRAAVGCPSAQHAPVTARAPCLPPSPVYLAPLLGERSSQLLIEPGSTSSPAAFLAPLNGHHSGGNAIPIDAFLF